MHEDVPCKAGGLIRLRRRANLPPTPGNTATPENTRPRHTHTPEQFLHSVPLNNMSSYVLSCSIGGHVVSFLVDTGGGVSLLNKDIWNRLKSKEDLIVPAASHRLMGVDGAPLNILGSAIIPITISGMTFKLSLRSKSQQMLSYVWIS